MRLILGIFLSSFLAFNIYASPVDQYWGEHTVNSRPFKTPEESLWYLSWRNEQYPLFTKLMFSDLKDSYQGKVVLDYGCGPGNDIVNFLIYSKAKKIIGIDISQQALSLTKQRLDLHRGQGYDVENRVLLVKGKDDDSHINLPNNSVDTIISVGVLHHTSNPQKILQEFNRILKPGGTVKIMVYNRNSIFTHYYVGYQKMVLSQPIDEVMINEKQLPKNQPTTQSLDEIFKQCTDGKNCPKALAWSQESFSNLAKSAGFNVEYIDAYFAQLELDIYKQYGLNGLKKIAAAKELNIESKSFLSNLQAGEDGLPKFHDKNAGIGAIYVLSKPR
ncbi:MAG: class I SAM-dependent methyltransferase [Gammaproteobacteria bacterium]|nr:class I SAM-dependent methyltransferase [Gammaproteobacteria bacterium]